jgi:hypothetical protein
MAPQPTVASTFEEARLELNKPYFQNDPWGEGWQRVLGQAMDRALDRVTQARRARWPGYCPSDGLLYLSKERGLERVRLMGKNGQLEAEDDHRIDLIGAWDTWAQAGSAQSHLDAFDKCALKNVFVFRRHEWSTPPPTLNAYLNNFQSNVWAQFDVMVDKPHPWAPVFWGGGQLWGGVDWTWGSNATYEDIQQLKRQLWRFRSGHETPTWIVVNTTTGRLWGAWNWGDGGIWGGVGEPVRWLVGEPHWRTRGLV